jgi:hypothetical protein
MAAATLTTSVVTIGSVVGTTAAFITDSILRTPMPYWLHLHIVHLHRRDIPEVAAAVGLAAALAVSIPVGRTIVRGFHRRHAARVRALAEAVIANVKLLTRGEPNA